MLRGRGVRSGKPGGAAPRGGVSGPASVGSGIGSGSAWWGGLPFPAGPASYRARTVRRRPEITPVPRRRSPIPPAAGPRAGSARSPAARRQGKPKSAVRRLAERRGGPRTRGAASASGADIPDPRRRARPAPVAGTPLRGAGRTCGPDRERPPGNGPPEAAPRPERSRSCYQRRFAAGRTKRRPAAE